MTITWCIDAVMCLVCQGTLDGLKHFDPSFPACDSTHLCRPHTVSSAYERSTLTRPSITSNTFVDPGNAGAEKVGAIYATPNSSAARMADIQSRLSLIYGRRHNVTPQLPSVPAQYSTLGGATVASRSGVKNKQMPPLFHRSCSLPPPVNLYRRHAVVVTLLVLHVTMEMNSFTWKQELGTCWDERSTA